MLKKKIEYGREFLANHLTVFRCPKCEAAFVSMKGNSLICENNHRYDVSKKGTLHFPDHHMTSDYDRDMLTSRRQMIQEGLYAPIVEKINELLGKEQVVADMGCGEGSFVNLLKAKQPTNTFMGFDLSKEGVQLASDFNEDGFFFIGDVTNMPFQKGSIDSLLNIFSPSHYEEMLRVLKPEGQIIKVIPESGYLKEMREVFYQDQPEKQKYSNENVYEKFKKDVSLIQEERVTYQIPVTKDNFENILKMSPIHWGASSEAKEFAKNNPFKKLTIDVKILVGKSQKFSNSVVV